jgi:hypothetical protein
MQFIVVDPQDENAKKKIGCDFNSMCIVCLFSNHSTTLSSQSSYVHALGLGTSSSIGLGGDSQEAIVCPNGTISTVASMVLATWNLMDMAKSILVDVSILGTIKSILPIQKFQTTISSSEQ